METFYQLELKEHLDHNMNSNSMYFSSEQGQDTGGSDYRSSESQERHKHVTFLPSAHSLCDNILLQTELY
jgi:hypothetical protein